MIIGCIIINMKRGPVIVVDREDLHEENTLG